MKLNARITQVAILCAVILVALGLSSCRQSNPPQKTELPSFVPLSAGAQVVWGVVLGGGDQTPEGLMDAPRTFIYQVRLDSGEEINVSYTAYPPSPSDEGQPAPKLTFYNGVISAGDYLVAQGTYDTDTRTLNVAHEPDFIETFIEKP
ncbi:MAG: hypothetical protein MUO40_02680 [Anaerolineaceae bacterium]|nr:hypothetical protein [Anaerolineaceae bacterium]